MEYIVNVRLKNTTYHKIESQPSGNTEHDNFKDLADQLNKKEKEPKYWVYSSIVSVIVLLSFIASYNFNPSEVTLSFILIIIFNISIYFFTIVRKQISLIYNFSDQKSLEDYLNRFDAIERLTKSNKKWFITSNLLDPTPRYTSVARYLLTYKKLKIRRRTSGSNLAFYTIKANKNLFIFLPDQLLIKTPDGYISKSYADFITRVFSHRRVEKLRNIPKDTPIVAPIYYERLEKHLKKKFKKRDKLLLVQYRMITFQIKNTNIYEQLLFSTLH